MKSNLTSNSFRITNSNMEWKDFIQLQNQYKERVSENYRLRENNIRNLHGQFFEQQMKEDKQK